MGERYYPIESESNGNTYLLRFSESSDIGCLCTFPGNYQVEEYIDADTMASLATLGAAVILAIWHPEQLDADEDFGNNECLTLLSNALPKWIQNEIECWQDVMKNYEEY